MQTASHSTLPSQPTCPLTQREETLALFLEGAGFEREARCEVIGALREDSYMKAVGRQLGRRLFVEDERAILRYFARGIPPEQAALWLAQPQMVAA